MPGIGSVQSSGAMIKQSVFQTRPGTEDQTQGVLRIGGSSLASDEAGGTRFRSVNLGEVEQGFRDQITDTNPVIGAKIDVQG